MTTVNADEAPDIELRQVDPARNRFRLYAITECRTLFGELCLRIVWGRIGNRRLRERSETFADAAALEQRRAELLARRASHGYVRADTGAAPAIAAIAPSLPTPNRAREEQRAIVEAHGLPMADGRVRRLVQRWVHVTRALASRVRVSAGETLGLDDVGSLAAMYASAAGVS